MMLMDEVHVIIPSSKTAKQQRLHLMCNQKLHLK